MIRSEDVSGAVLRLYPEQSADKYAPYSASCVVHIGADGVPEIKAMSGTFHARYLKELAQWFLVQGFTEVKATRAPGHRLPGATRKGDYYWWTEASLKRIA
jgi:hypothetical protein